MYAQNTKLQSETDAIYSGDSRKSIVGMGVHSTADTGYFYAEGGPNDRTLNRSFQDIKSIQQGTSCVLDLVAICEAIGSCSFIGDRTIVTDIKRTPWLSRVSPDGRSWTDGATPVHGAKHDSHEGMAEALLELLSKELSTVISGKSRIGILLSGGMDSRIVAGILSSLQRQHQDLAVTAFTWGIESSRDPVYARKIAKLYGWDFEHFDITADTLRKNIEVSAKEGCFYAANHLHAMPDVADRAKALGMECMIAASYGDSIGRAEYRGARVMDLPPIDTRLADNFLLLDPEFFDTCRSESLKEIARYHRRFGDKSEWEIAELDNQLHYMRNQLGTCMNVIDCQVPLFQAFTSDEVVNLMWSYHPKRRGDEVYAHLLELIDPELFEIPWARTGQRYLREDDRPDDLVKRYHLYGKWCREDLAEYLDDLIFGGELQKTNLLNDRQLKIMLWANRRFCRTDNRNKIDEVSLWLASFSLFLKDKNWRFEKGLAIDNKRSLLAYWKILRFAATFVLKHNRINA